MTPSTLRLLTDLPDLPTQVADTIALGRDIAAALDTAQGQPVDWAHVAEQLAATPAGKRAAYARAALDNHATYLARIPLAAELRRAAARDIEAALHQAVTTHLEQILQLIAGPDWPTVVTETHSAHADLPTDWDTRDISSPPQARLYGTLLACRADIGRVTTAIGTLMPPHGGHAFTVPTDVATELKPAHLVWSDYPTHPNGLPGATDPLLRLRAVLDTGARLRPWPSLQAAVTELRDRAAAEQQRRDALRRPVGARAAGF